MRRSDPADTSSVRRRPRARLSAALGLLAAVAVGAAGCVAGPPAPPEPAPSTEIVATIDDAIQEWWIGPVVQQQSDWYSTAALSETGEVEAVDIDDTGATSRTVVGTAPVDDHNVPARITLPGRGSLVQWTHHGTEEGFYVSVAPGSGRAETFADRPVTEITVGSKVSYGQILHIPDAQTADTDTFWVLLRNDLNWGIAELVVNWSTGEASYSGKYRRLITFPEQAYLTSTFDDTSAGTVRIAAGYNPAVGRSEVYLLELDLRTGILTDLMKPRTTHDITSSTYLSAEDLTPVLGQTSGTRRLLDVRASPAAPAVLTVEYPGDVSPDGVYTETAVDENGLTTSRTFGKTGAHLERYPCGASFGIDGSVWHCGEDGGTSSLWRDDRKILDSEAPLFRPMPTPGGPVSVLVGRIERYEDYRSWSGSSLLAVAVR